MLEVHLFDQVCDAVRSLVADEAPDLRLRAHRRGVKAWFGSEKPPREHFEAQILPRRYLDGTEGMTVEIGFHAEHKELAANEAAIARLLSREKTWRKQLGDEAEAGVFFGADKWRRISEVWVEPDLDDPEVAFEIAARLADYLLAMEPILSSNGSDA